jgi:hypothetical protein
MISVLKALGTLIGALKRAPKESGIYFLIPKPIYLFLYSSGS